MKINQTDLVKEVADDTELNIDEIKTIINSFINIIKRHLFKGDIVGLVKFVNFKVDRAKKKRTYNFKTGEVRELPNRKLPKAEFNPDFIREIKNTGI
jgi:nucleoid DNA-binding protein